MILSARSAVVKLGREGGTAANTWARIRCSKPTVGGPDRDRRGEGGGSHLTARLVGSLGVGPTALYQAACEARAAAGAWAGSWRPGAKRHGKPRLHNPIGVMPQMPQRPLSAGVKAASFSRNSTGLKSGCVVPAPQLAPATSLTIGPLAVPDGHFALGDDRAVPVDAACRIAGGRDAAGIDQTWLTAGCRRSVESLPACARLRAGFPAPDACP